MRRSIGGLIPLAGLSLLAQSAWRGAGAARRPPARASEPATDWPFVSVLVPAWNDRAELQACLSSLAWVDYPDHEVIIVAGGADGTYEAALAASELDHRIRVVEQLPLGKNAALNQATALARGRILVLLDADSRLTPQWLKGLVGALRGNVAASTGNYLPLDETAVSLCEDLAKVYEYEVRDRVILQGSGGIAVRREALDAVGPFPEERVSSDWDLDARLAAQGCRKVFAREAVIRSRRPSTLPEWWRNELRWRRLHIRSLMRLKGDAFSNPVVTAQHLYPYVTSWTMLLSTLVAATTLVLRPKQGRGAAAIAGWTALASLFLAHEIGPVLAVFVYQPSLRWLPVIPMTPLLTALTWAACCVASVTPGKAALQFKGARKKAASPDDSSVSA